MTSSARNDLPLADYVPRSMLVVEEHQVPRARFPVIDIHNHLGRWLTNGQNWMAPDVEELLSVLDACNVEAVVNLDGMWGDELEANLDRYDRAHPERFFTFAHADWSLVTEPEFGARMAKQLEDSVRRGARGLKVWKNFGLHFRDANDRLISIDDERLFDLWEAAGEQDVPVLIHIADPVAFFLPLDRFNERWEELQAHPDWHFPSPPFPSFDALMEQFEHLIARHPRTVFIGAHVGCYAENLGWVSRVLETYSNFYVDIAQRISELGRQPYSARRLLARHPGRVLFGIDLFPPQPYDYARYFRFLETEDEYFSYSSGEVGDQGRWFIYGLGLSDEVLGQVYHDTAARLLTLRDRNDGLRGAPI